MAYFNDPQEDELLNQQNAQGPQATGPQGATLQGSGSTGGPAPAPASTPATPDKGSNFVGINQYLNANKSQAGKLGDQASGVITNSANEARSSVQGLNDSFNQKVGTAATIDQNILGRVNEAEKLNDQEKGQIKSAYNAQYTGPNSLTDLGDEYNAAGQKLSTAKKNVESAGTEEGRQGLITQINSKPRTTGITNFDSVLLQAGGGREKLNQAATANKDVAGDVLSQNNLLAQQKASDIKAQTDATRTATQGAVTGAQTALKSPYDMNDPLNKVTAAMKQALGKYQPAYDDLSDLSLDQETLDLLGLQEGQSTYGVNLRDFVKNGDPTSFTTETVATPDEYARAAALADLSGQPQDFLNPKDASKAGTAKGASFDIEGLKAAIESKGGKYSELEAPATIVTDSRFNSVPEQLVPGGGHPLLAAGGERMYREMVNGKTPAQLKAIIGQLENSARTQYHDPGLSVSAPAWVANNIKKYLSDLNKKIESKYTVKKNK